MHEMTMDGDRFVKMLKGRAVGTYPSFLPDTAGNWRSG